METGLNGNMENTGGAVPSFGESEHLYRSLVDNLPVGVALIGPNLEVLAENATVRQWFPETDQHRYPICYKVFNTPARESPCENCPVLMAFRDGKRHQAEREVETSLGARILWITSIPTVAPDGTVQSVQEMVEDITEWKQTEERLALQSAALKNTADGIVITDREGVIQWMNPAFSRVTGYTLVEAAGKTPRILKSGAHPQELYSEMWRTLLEGRVWRGELTNRRKDGSFYEAENSITPVRTEGEEISHFVAVQRDVTERKRAEEELKQKSEAMENSREGIAILDENERYTYLNTAHATLYGYEGPEELLGNTWRILYRQEEIERFEREVLPVLAREGSWGGETRGLKRDGATFPVQVSLTVLDDGGLICVARDITHLKQAEQDRIARQAAEEANRAKSIFVSNMSHEIRTPLNAILGFAQIIERDVPLTPKQAEHVATILSSGRHLLDLINDILDMSKIESGRLELSMTDFSLHHMLGELERMFKSRAEAKGLQLILERDASVPEFVNTDEAKLRQVLVNLMANAVKFTEVGGVAVRVKAKEPPAGTVDEQGTLRLVVEVEDSGPGIPKDEQGRIFDAFQQASGSRDAGGTGLGLAISRRIVEMMGGSIRLESEVGKGTTFRVDVPVAEAEEVVLEPEAEPRRVVGLQEGTPPVRILVVDDQKNNRDLLTNLLEPMGFEVREAGTGYEALQEFEAWRPQAVLMDLRMPVMDGYEATRRIKATARGRATPVIAVTARAFEEEKKAVLASGVDGYVRKPFRPEELFEELRKSLGLTFIYADGEREKESIAVSLKQEDMAPLPDALLSAMKEAVEDGDTALLEELISRVEQIDARVGKGLLELAGRYDYETLLNLFDGEGGLSRG